MAFDAAHRWPGVPLALASAALFGMSTPIAKALQRDLSPALLAGLLYVGSGLGLLLVNGLQRATGRTVDAPIRRKEWPRLLTIVLTGGVVGPVLLMVGLSVTAASSASLLLNLEGVFSLGLA